MSVEKDFSDLVRSLRVRLDLTQEKFAAKLGVTFASVNSWENGKTKPSPLAIKQIEDIVKDLGDKGSDLLEQYFGNKE